MTVTLFRSVTVWYLRPAASFGSTGKIFGWWLAQGGYYGVVFKSFWGVTQGDLLYPTIFNGVVYAVVHQWISLVEGGEYVRKYGEGRCNISPPFSMHIMAW